MNSNPEKYMIMVENVETDEPMPDTASLPKRDVALHLHFDNISLTPIVHTWVPVMSGDGSIYRFPEAITAHMRAALRRPAIYRWKILRTDGTTEFYIGETAELCPQRVNQYRRGDESQKTNKKLHDHFCHEIVRGATVTIEVLSFKPFIIEKLVIDEKSLDDGYVRKFIENLMIVLMKANGDTLLNR